MLQLSLIKTISTLMKILETDRLILRTWQAEDIAPMAAINQDPKVMAYFPALLDLARTKLLIKKFTEYFDEYRYTLYAAERMQLN